MAGLQRIKGAARRSAFIHGIVRALRALPSDITRFRGWLTRPSEIKTYLNQNGLKKLQIGTSDTLMPGWLNTDWLPRNRNVIYLDATAPFPFEDDVFDYVYSEHMIEHIPYENGFSMLQECFRILKPGGKIRLSTPDLKVYANLQSDEKTPAQEFYINWMVQKFMPDVDYCKEVFLINNAFRSWGHQFLYDRETLGATLEKIGFEDVKYYQPRVSDDENLRNIEMHGDIMGSEEINQFEAFALEARIPTPKKRTEVAKPVRVSAMSW